MKLKYESIIKKMTLKEKAMMTSGKNTWKTVDFEKYGIPSIMMSDGPHGMRTQDPKEGDHLGLNGSLPATCFPTAATIANSFNEELGEHIGEALAKEAQSLDVQVILGPGLNIKRSPLCGRNFEYFSEDPYLSGKMAAAYIRGIQRLGVSACPKHFAANSQELRRMASDSIVDERTLHEIYLTGFEIAVKEGNPLSLMSSYNRINGTYANENPYLLQDLLRNQWGFKGYVVSDWGGSNDHALGVKHGSHLEMPGTGKSGVKDILDGIKEGVLSEEELDLRVDELLDVIFTLHSKKQETKTFDIEKHHELAREAARQGIVLLKNEDDILPLKPKTKVAILGDFASSSRYQGAGSSIVNPTKKPESILDCLSNYDLDYTYAKGYERNSTIHSSLIEEAIIKAKEADVVLIFAGLDEINESEGMDRSSMKMPEAQNELIQAITKNHSNVVVVLSCGSAIEMPWIHDVKGIVHGYLGGQAGASAMLDILTGAYNPSGKLNETYPIVLSDTPTYAYYPGKERNSEYREGLYVGYRYYTSVDKKVNYPFGYGLSYTTFAYSNLTVSKDGVTFKLKNTGNREGVEIAQLYIGKESNSIYRPIRELKGFKRIHLNVNEEKEIFIPFDDKTFRFFDTTTHTFQVESGSYKIMIGTNANTIVLETDFFVEGIILEENNQLRYPSYFNGNIENVSDKEFEALYGKPIPKERWTGILDINDPVSKFNQAKSPLARFLYKILKKRIEKKLLKGDPNINEMFVFNMPIRSIPKYASGIVNKDGAYALLDVFNGHFFKGMYRFIKSLFYKV